MRISGKRQLGELQLSELVTAFLISEVASSPITNNGFGILNASVSIALLVFLEIVVSFITTKSFFAKKVFEPSPTVLISNGKLNSDELGKQRLTVDELISSLRLKDISDISSVKYCFLEHNGEISAFKEGDILTIPVIVDGHIYRNHLKNLGKDENWLSKRLKEQKLTADQVFIGVSDGNTLTVFAKKK
jgi:uncharacterized membrane protein YcaP (DUF421 family)